MDELELFACPPLGVVDSCVIDGTLEAGTRGLRGPFRARTTSGHPSAIPPLVAPAPWWHPPVAFDVAMEKMFGRSTEIDAAWLRSMDRD